jgi:patatin-like phospholipase/acyl hydrolase
MDARSLRGGPVAGAVLCIDGGGIRGLIPALVLAEIEARTGRRTAELFDLIAGTSTGGILACALAKPDALSAEELAALYVEHGPRIFHRNLLKRISSVEGFVDERYDDNGLMEALRRYLGDARLRESTCDVFITAYDIKDRFAFFFRSSRARRDPTYDFSLVEAARATAAAPTYFEPFQVTDAAGARTYPLIDGGVYAVNPAMCAYAETRGEFDVMLSLGTGEHTRAYDYDQARGWGQIGWARPVLDMVFDGVADTIEFELKMLAPDRYFRLQTALTASDDLDDASLENLAALAADAGRLLRDHARELDAVIERL